jgi:hypothetical protein
LQVGVDLGVVDHLAEEEDGAAGVFFDGAKGDFDGVLDSIAEPEMPGEVNLQVAEVQQGRREILFHFILLLSPAFDGRDEGAAIDDRDIEIFHKRV